MFLDILDVSLIKNYVSCTYVLLCKLQAINELKGVLIGLSVKHLMLDSIFIIAVF